MSTVPGLADWRLAGLVPVMHAEGPDVTRSAAGRAGGEAVWVPTALLPRFGVAWTAESDHRITARFTVDDVPIEINLLLDAQGRAVSFSFARWGDPDGSGEWGWHPFGGDVTEHRTFGGLTVPAAGRIGWFPGSAEWANGRVLPLPDHRSGARDLVPGFTGPSALCLRGMPGSTLGE